MDLHLTSVSPPPAAPPVEVVERKGLGHPDTLCDAVAEAFSVALSRFYLDRFGAILHHNVDKALLRGGSARARFGGGEVLEPIDVYLAGRAVTSAGGVTVPVEELAVETVRAELRSRVRHLDVDRHVRVHCLVRPGSVDLSALFTRERARGVAFANDTSFGVGYAPLDPLETLALRAERELNAPAYLAAHPAHGEDVKVMATRTGPHANVTVARAFVAGHVPTLDAYLAEKAAVEQHVRALGESLLGAAPDVRVNAADAKDGSAVYLTVTGTSAEAGDDGQVGRGNRANGLITPMRPMSLEATAGKNSVSHVGKLYNVTARAIAARLLGDVGGVVHAECVLVSRIGARIDDPAAVHLRLAGVDSDAPEVRRAAEAAVRAELERVPSLYRDILAGTVELF